MNSDFKSIEDLLPEDGDGSKDEDTTQGKFQSKQVEIKKKEAEKITEEKANSAGLPYINLTGFPISPEALSKISEEESKRLKVACFLYNGEELRLGAVAVTTEVEEILKQLTEKLHVKGQLYLISEDSLQKAIVLYKNIAKPKNIVKGVKVTEEELNKYSEKFSSFKDLQSQIVKADVSQTVSMMLAAAIKSRASDIHIESEEKEIKVRYRIDGVLQDVAMLDQERREKIVSRLKVLAKVKINVIDRPQDGRFTIFMKERKIDIRISFLPTAYGESVVMRLLDSKKQDISFENLGLVDKAFEQLKREVERPNGMIITTGPTGSGKTTTLYAILRKLNQPKTKIITIEDPIEYQIEGINQSQTSENYTFAKGLRSIVRQDPDVIMVGEVRDLETAEIATQAALTGHLVLSTIHTNDASGTIPRLLSMGLKPFLLAPSLNAMIGQRLVRRVCDKCKKEIALSDEQKKRIEDIMDKLPEEEKGKYNIEEAKFQKGEGCDECQSLGYKGRIGIYEIMVMNADIEKLIQEEKVSEFNIAEVASKGGMITMAQDGIIKAMQGKTTIEEVLRVAE